jgi:alcohol dehydrogenase
MAKNRGRYWDYITGGSGKGQILKNGALPIVAIPTTAGTGSEVDPWTVITKSGAREKIGWGGGFTFPILSFIDPEIMTTVPPVITAHTGMDALFHAVESYLSTARQPASDSLALQAIELITEYLPIAVMDGTNIKARAALAWASAEAGICESLSSCISHHSIEHAVSAYYPKVTHGAGLTMLSIAYFNFLSRKAPTRFPAMARAMGENLDSLPEGERPSIFITALRKLISNIGLEEERLSRHGVTHAELKEIAENSLYTMGGLYEVTPTDMSIDDVVGILEEAY